MGEFVGERGAWCPCRVGLIGCAASLTRESAAYLLRPAADHHGAPGASKHAADSLSLGLIRGL